MVSLSLLATLTMTLYLVIGPLALASCGMKIPTVMLVSLTSDGSVGLSVGRGENGTSVGAVK